MILPKDILSDTYTRPQVFLCETDKTKICELDVSDLSGVFKFNSYSEVSCFVPRELTNNITGQSYVHPFYNKIEALRLLDVDGFGYFEIQNPNIESDGIREVKNITAYSYEYTLSHKYIENLIVNNPDIEGNIGGGNPSSEEVDDRVSFYNTDDVTHSLLHLALQKAYGWNIGYVDPTLATQSRSFEIDRTTIYDFLMNDVADTFKCYFVFDTINNLINVYAEARRTQHVGDGKTVNFVVDDKYALLGDVTINGYRTLNYVYDATIGIITFDEPPVDKAIIDIYDGSQAEWQTDVLISFDNLASSMQIEYSADDIKTVLKITGSDDLNIRDVNLGLDYIMNLSYYHTIDWMGEKLYNRYSEYLKLIENKTPNYTQHLKDINDLWDEYYELHNRVSTEPYDYNKDDEIEVKVNLTNEKLNYFKLMLQQYYKNKNIDGNFPDSDTVIVDKIKEDFAFLQDNLTTYLDILQGGNDILIVETETDKILDIIWDEYGIALLQENVDAYKKIEETHVESEWSNIDNEKYYMHWANYRMKVSCEKDLQDRKNAASAIDEQIKNNQKEMSNIADQVAMQNFFTHEELIRLNAFIREDEYSDDNFLVTEQSTNAEVFQSKEELLQCGKIELSRLSEPTLSFGTNMANIYAIEAFEPIMHQFQLGKLIKIALRSDYIKQSRLMEVNINFDNLSDFSVTFGDLVSTKNPIDIHAELLQQAASAGKSVASNSSYWNKSSDIANTTDKKIQNGLIDATTSIKSSSNNQAIEWDEHGLHIRKYIDGSTTEYDPKQAWFINNKLLFTKDNWKTTESALGEITYNKTVGKDDEGNPIKEQITEYGLLAKAVLAGYIEGSTLVGGVIKIGDRGDGTYNFEIDEDGIVTFRGDQTFTQDMNEINLQLDSLRATTGELSDNVDEFKKDLEAFEKDLTEIVGVNTKVEELKDTVNNISKDYIVENGTNGIWTYEKWNSGKALCWGRQTYKNIRFTQLEDTNMYIYTTSSHISYPENLFIDIPKEQVTGKCQSIVSWICNTPDSNNLNSTTHTGMYGFITPTNLGNATPQEAHLDFYIMGKWKD